MKCAFVVLKARSARQRLSASRHWEEEDHDYSRKRRRIQVQQLKPNENSNRLQLAPAEPEPSGEHGDLECGGECAQRVVHTQSERRNTCGVAVFAENEKLDRSGRDAVIFLSLTLRCFRLSDLFVRSTC